MGRISCLSIWMLVFWTCNILAQGISVIQIARVLPANSLSGVVTFEGDPLPGVLVEECTPNWVKPIASTRTDENGNFKLPIVNREPIYYLRISKHGWNTLLVKVKVSPKAGTLVLELELST